MRFDRGIEGTIKASRGEKRRDIRVNGASDLSFMTHRRP